MYGEGGTIDSITLINALQNRGLLDEVGGKAVVHTLASTVPAVANARATPRSCATPAPTAT